MGVSSGDPLKINAADWNRVLQAIRSWRPPAGESHGIAGLPSLKLVMGTDRRNDRRPCLGEAVLFMSDGVSSQPPIEATLPLSETWKPSVRERYVARGGVMRYRLMRPLRQTGTEIGDDEEDFEKIHAPFAICLNPRTLTFAMSGIALARVRYHSQWHQYARRPMLTPADSSSDYEKYTGCLDSSGAGPAFILGWVADTSTYGTKNWAVSDEAKVFGKVYWALLKW